MCVDWKILSRSIKILLGEKRLTDVCKDIKHFEDWFTSIEARQGVYKNLWNKKCLYHHKHIKGFKLLYILS